MKKHIALLVLVALAALASCKKSGNGSSSSEPSTPPGSTSEKPASDTPAPPAKPLATEAEMTALVEGNNAFAFDLYKALRATPGNLAFSPASVSTALAMTYAGARNNTEAEMKATLHFELEQSRLHPAFADLLAGLIAGPGADNYDLAIANRLWGDKASTFLPDFLTLTENLYGARLEQLDFRGDADGGRKVINAWVEEQTKKRITELLKPGIITDRTRLVLTNAIYFKGTWLDPFEKKATREQTFHAPDGEQKVQMMHKVEDLRAYEGDGIKALELPYQGEDLSMVFLLPDARDGLAALEEQLGADALKRWLDGMHEQKVVAALPRFEVTSDFGLHEVLPDMGMKEAFSMAADFSGMNGDTDLYITAVVHKAFVKVDEEGSEAAAATAVVVGEKGVAKQPLQFIADHPFLFLIRDKRTGSILFLGRVSSPA
jgi:serpin B